MKLLDIAHPAAKTLVDISMSQDAEARLRLKIGKKTTVLSGKGGSSRVLTVLFYGGN